MIVELARRVVGIIAGEDLSRRVRFVVGVDLPGSDGEDAAQVLLLSWPSCGATQAVPLGANQAVTASYMP
jgi:hypothetical protein